jgi:hypothetical protein
MQDKRHLAKKMIIVADAVAMNAVPEYWLGFKQAGLHIVSILSIAKKIIATSH